jgi:hypothetical protein
MAYRAAIAPGRPAWLSVPADRWENLRRRGLGRRVVAFTSTQVTSDIQPVEGWRKRIFWSAEAIGKANRPAGFSTLVEQEHRGRPYNNVRVGFGAAYPGFLAVTYAAWLGCRSLVLVRWQRFDHDWFETR